MDDGTPTLEVGFAIETGGSFEALLKLQAIMDSTEVKVAADAAKIERATAGMANVSPAIAKMISFGNEVTKVGEISRREFAQIEKSGEALVRQLERQNAAYGKTREELRGLRAEERATAAERVNNLDLAMRIRAEESALFDKEFAAARKARFEAEALAHDQMDAAQKSVAAANAQAQALREAAFAHDKFEAAARKGMAALREFEAAQKAAASDAAAQRIREAAYAYDKFEAAARKGAAALRQVEAAEAAAGREAATAALRAEAVAAEKLATEHARLAAIVQGSNAAQEADHASLERLRAATDPLYAATKRLNAEIAESTRLYHNGVTAPVEYARQQEVLGQRLRTAALQHDASAMAARRNGFALQQVAVQIPDIVQGLLTGQKPMQVFLQQGGQIAQIGMMAEGGLKGLGAQLGGIALAALPAAAALGMAGVAAYRWYEQLNKDADMKTFVDGLGLTQEELKKVGAQSVTTGDLLGGLWKTISDGLGLAGSGKSIMDWLFSPDDAKQVQTFVSQIYGVFAGGYAAIVELWGNISGVVSGYVAAAAAAAKQFFAPVVAAAQWASNLIGALFATMYNRVAGWLKSIGSAVVDFAAPILKALGQSSAASAATSAGSGLGKAFGKGYADGAAKVVTSTNSFFAKVGANAIDKAQERLVKSADALKASRSTGGGAGRSGAAKQITDEQRAYEAALKAANDYIAAQEKDTARIGKSAKEIRLMEDALQRLAAPLAAQKLKLDQVATAREKAYSEKAATDFKTNIMKPLQDELALYGLVGPARAAATLDLEKQSFIAKNMDDGIVVATARWQEYYDVKKKLIDKDSAAEREAEAVKRIAEHLDDVVDATRRAGDAMAQAFGRVGGAIADSISLLTEYGVHQRKIDDLAASGKLKQDEAIRQSADLQLSTTIGLTSAAKSLFNERSKGYQAMAAAEKALTLIQLARTAVDVAGGAARMFATLGPLAFPAVAAMLAVMASLGFGGGGSSSGPKLPKANDGTGTVLGDASAKSESIKRAIDALAEVDTTMLSYSREMAATLKSIDSQIGGVASLIVRAGNIDASGGVNTGFKSNATGTLAAIGGVIGGPIGAGIGALLTKIPVIGDLLSSLFGTKTSVLANGLYGGPQTVGSIVNNGFDAQYYSDIEKKKKFLGITTSTKYSTQYGAADAGLENQFTLILKSFNDAITAAAGPLGVATGDIQARLNSFVVNIGKIDLKGLTGEQIQEKLTAIFGAAADGMANAAFPGIAQFQKVGEGAFETLVRVASTVEAVGASLDLLGTKAQGMGIAVKLGLADQFDSVSALTSAADAYFQAFYSKEEQAAAKTAQFAKVFDSLGLSMPSTLAGFRQLVEAQDLTSAAGQATYATLLKLAPAFADLQAAMDGAKSAADIASERQDLQRQLLELQGNTAAIRALDLAKLDASNRALQEQIWAVQDAQEAAKAAADLASAWSSVGDSITDEIKRIRGLAETGTSGGFASILGQFNAANTAARGGDMDAAKSLPGLSQALLTAAALVATSRQELDRIQAQTAAALEATNAAIKGAKAATTIGTPTSATTASGYAILDAASLSQAATAPAAANDDTASELRALRAEMAQMRADNNAGHAATAGNTGRIARKFDDVTAASGGDAISVADAA